MSIFTIQHHSTQHLSQPSSQSEKLHVVFHMAKHQPNLWPRKDPLRHYRGAGLHGSNDQRVVPEGHLRRFKALLLCQTWNDLFRVKKCYMMLQKWAKKTKFRKTRWILAFFIVLNFTFNRSNEIFVSPMATCFFDLFSARKKKHFMYSAVTVQARKRSRTFRSIMIINEYIITL